MAAGGGAEGWKVFNILLSLFILLGTLQPGWNTACCVAFFECWSRNSIISSGLQFSIHSHAIPVEDTFPVSDAWQHNLFADLLEQIWEREKVQVHVSCALWSAAVELIRIPEFFTSLSVQIFLWRRRNYHQSPQRKAVVARSLAGNLKPSPRPPKKTSTPDYSFTPNNDKNQLDQVVSHSTSPAEVQIISFLPAKIGLSSFFGWFDLFWFMCVSTCTYSWCRYFRATTWALGRYQFEDLKNISWSHLLAWCPCVCQSGLTILEYKDSFM